MCAEIDCFKATAAFGSLLESQINILRAFLDPFLLRNTAGKTFWELYNTYSHPLAHFIARHDNLRVIVRFSLLPIIGVSWVCLKFGPAKAMLLILLSLVLISTTAVFMFSEKI